MGTRLILSLVAGCALLPAQQPDSAPARRAAEAWTPLVDSGKYAESWQQASADFRKGVTKQQWQQALTQVRGPLGKFKSRSFAAAQFVRDPPNAPPGDYFLLQYNADFEHKNGATETVVMLIEQDRRWRVSGYFIK